MGIKIGNIDISTEIVELHYQLRRTQNLLELVVNKSPVLSDVLSEKDINDADADALEFVQKRFPDMGIHKKG